MIKKSSIDLAYVEIWKVRYLTEIAIDIKAPSTSHIKLCVFPSVLIFGIVDTRGVIVYTSNFQPGNIQIHLAI